MAYISRQFMKEAVQEVARRFVPSGNLIKKAPAASAESMLAQKLAKPQKIKIKLSDLPTTEGVNRAYVGETQNELTRVSKLFSRSWKRLKFALKTLVNPTVKFKVETRINKYGEEEIITTSRKLFGKTKTTVKKSEEAVPPKYIADILDGLS